MVNAVSAQQDHKHPLPVLRNPIITRVQNFVLNIVSTNCLDHCEHAREAELVLAACDANDVFQNRALRLGNDNELHNVSPNQATAFFVHETLLLPCCGPWLARESGNIEIELPDLAGSRAALAVSRMECIAWVQSSLCEVVIQVPWGEVVLEDCPGWRVHLRREHMVHFIVEAALGDEVLQHGHDHIDT